MRKKMLFLCAMLVFALSACGGDREGGGSSDAGQSGQGSSESVPVEDAGDSSESAPSEDASDSGEALPEESADGSGSAGEGWSQEMEQLKAAAVEAAEGGYWPDMPLEPDMLEMSFSITPDMYEDYMAEMPMMSAHVDTLLIIKAKDDKVEAVQAAVEAYREAKVSDTMQYPMNLGKIQASRIETIGNYVMFVQLGGDTTQADEEGDEAVAALCQERNDKVIEAVRGKL